MKLLEVSPFKSSAVSLDLLNLYVVNQISTKKENNDNIQKPVHVDINKDIQIPLRNQYVEFSKSPECRPTKPFPDDIQHRIQEEILDNRRKYLFEKARIHSEDLGYFLPVNNKVEDCWLSTGEFSVPDSDAPIGHYFQQLNSPGYGNSIDKDSGNSQANSEEPLFDTVNGMVKPGQDVNFQPIATLFEEENQQFLTFHPSQSYCSFPNKSHIDQVFIHFGDAKEESKHNLYDSEEMHQMTSLAQTCAAERDLTSIFTAPDMICSPNNLNAINQKSIWNQSKDFSIQKINPVEFSEQQKLTMFFENPGFKNQRKYTKVPKTIQNYLSNSRKEGQADPNMNYLKIFEHETLHKEVYSDFDQHSNQRRQNDDDSQLSSQSPTYSPKEAERYSSSSSDESKMEKWNEETSYDSDDSFSRTSNHPCSGSGNQRSQYVCQYDGGPWNSANIQPQAKSATTPGKNMLYRAGLQLSDRNCKGRHEVSSQTDKCTEAVEKSNAAVQCDIIQVCNCKNELSFAHCAETVTSTSKVETTGGQNIPSEYSTSAYK